MLQVLRVYFVGLDNHSFLLLKEGKAINGYLSIIHLKIFAYTVVIFVSF